MKILLIWPEGFVTKQVLPLSLAYLRANLDTARHEVRIADFSLAAATGKPLDLERLLAEFKPQLVGISCWSRTYPAAADLFRRVKAADAGIATVLGGVHATLAPEAAFENPALDYLMRGEGELSFPVFVEELERGLPEPEKVPGLSWRRPGGGTVHNPIPYEKDLDKIRMPDYDGIRLDEYIENGYKYMSNDRVNAPVWVTRGCPYNCDFCSGPLLHGKAIRRHSVEYMVRWVKYLYHEKNVRKVNIIDDNFTFDTAYAKDFCRTMIGLGLKGLRFGTPNGIRVQRTDPELLGLMRQAGWEYVCVSPESGSLRTLKRMNKHLDPGIWPGKIAEIKAAGLKVIGFFIVGYPGEDLSDIQATVDLIRRCRFDFFYLFNFQPLPGTPVYERLLAGGEIPPGFFPSEYSSGESGYSPEALRGFNFASLRLKEYLYLVLTRPSTLFFVMANFDVLETVKRLLSNVYHMVVNSAEPVKHD